MEKHAGSPLKLLAGRGLGGCGISLTERVVLRWEGARKAGDS